MPSTGKVDQRAQWLEAARKAMETEAQAILTASGRLDRKLLRAVELILGHSGKLVVIGLGKSGHIARKIVATLQSTGTPAVFLHPTEAAHGDLGVCQRGDSVLIVSKSGATAELLDLLPPLRELNAAFIGILGNPASPLAREMDVVLDASIAREADPEGFTPTASSAVALALGDALAIALMQARAFTAEHFSRLHAGGQLGRNLRMRVGDAMHRGDEVAWVKPEDSLKHVVIAMSRHPLGAACVLSPAGQLSGLITDGDVRRALQDHDDIRTLRAADVMTLRPSTLSPDTLLHEALAFMEDRPSQISVVPVMDDSGRCLGLLRLHDIYQGRE
ncbi:MAG TPA: KpsF/GutQ family sugar-phosphate isomerase [Bryobacteraceae bacterium]|nr:KpsF/GutQ family sugar-phosphate isomerase [Bryobacteraceae bacterium]